MSRARRKEPDVDRMTLGGRIQGEILELSDGRKVRRSFQMGDDTVFVRVIDDFDGFEGDPEPMSAETVIVDIIEPRSSRGSPQHGRAIDESDPLQRKDRIL